jgi:aspartate aminotransferase
MRMNISSRMSQLMLEGAFTVLAKAKELERQGKSIIHFEIGQPDFPTPKHIVRAGIDALKMGKTKYSPSLGIYPLREALANHITDRTGVPTTVENIAVTPGCKTAIFCALASVIDPGDEVMYPDPGFPAYESLIKFLGGKPVAIPLVEEREFSFDMEFLKRKFSKKTKAIIFNFPSNPTGTLLPLADMKEIAELVSKTKTWIISDEIYTRMLYEGNTYTSIYSLPGMKEQTIIVDGYSKTYAMTGWRLGYLVVPDFLINKIDLLLVNSISCTAEFTQEAGLIALKSSQKCVEEMVAEFSKRREYLISALNGIDGITCLKPGGAFYAFFNVKAYGRPSEELASYILEEAGVALLPGTAFGKYGEGYLRISYSTSIKNLKEGVGRVKEALAKLSR